jgi:hypothetical protein
MLSPSREGGHSLREAIPPGGTKNLSQRRSVAKEALTQPASQSSPRRVDGLVCERGCIAERLAVLQRFGQGKQPRPLAGEVGRGSGRERVYKPGVGNVHRESPLPAKTADVTQGDHNRDPSSTLQHAGKPIPPFPIPAASPRLCEQPPLHTPRRAIYFGLAPLPRWVSPKVPQCPVAQGVGGSNFAVNRMTKTACGAAPICEWDIAYGCLRLSTFVSLTGGHGARHVAINHCRPTPSSVSPPGQGRHPFSTVPKAPRPPVRPTGWKPIPRVVVCHWLRPCYRWTSETPRRALAAGGPRQSNLRAVQ